jgi:hypothetical protein
VRFAGHLLAATVLPLVLVAAIGTLSSIASNGSKAIDYLTIGPSFLLPIISGGVLCYLFTRRAELVTPALWVWLVPAAVLIWSIRDWRHQAVDNSWQDVWNNFFGTRCSSSECLYEIITAVFLSSVSYSLVAFFLRRDKRGQLSLES